ncbi:ribosome recycling factor [Vibrio sp. S11_S32]|uniref:ribosome recycling factor family protein n=1 Tax=Vibrio sp. S11_S32 TaxID=2720225 RepID=UPI0016809A4D|nr:ribosome recycling factor family protein [Vibrio sp. S11_S32]MBD1577737.1 ribosome recycling factor [Vibrio sp. S11_S32]
MITIALPSLIHRIGRDRVKQAKSIALKLGCELKRIRRSRNWQLQGEVEPLSELIETLTATDPDTMSYLIKKITDGINTALISEEDSQPPPSMADKLAALIQSNPDITLNELMAITDCTMAQARSVRFEMQDFD